MLSAGAAAAADLPTKASVYSPAPVQTWTGFYVGANVGYGWGKFDGTSSITGNAFVPNTSASGSVSLNGVIGGGQVGYNWQTGQLVLGVEADFQGANERKTDSIGCGVGCVVSSDARLNSFATVRGRVGWTPWNEGLLYFTGGWAWMNAKQTVSVTAGGATATLIDLSANQSGYVLGAGYEHMLWSRWSAKLEYLYMRATGVSGSAAIPALLGGGTFTQTGTLTNNVVRVGLNYHF